MLSDDAFANARATFDRDRLWGLLHANPTPAQDLGALVLTERDWDETLTIRQITRLASHELATVREAAWAMVDRQPDRMRAAPIDALTLLDASWDDSRAFGFDFIRRTFDADVWTPDLLVHVVDSTRPDVQMFGQELIGQFFEDGDGPTYLLKLSEHPTIGVQTFASDYLENVCERPPRPHPDARALLPGRARPGQSRARGEESRAGLPGARGHSEPRGRCSSSPRFSRTIRLRLPSVIRPR